MRWNSTNFKLLGSIVIKTINCCKIIKVKPLCRIYLICNGLFNDALLTLKVNKNVVGHIAFSS